MATAHAQTLSKTTIEARIAALTAAGIGEAVKTRARGLYDSSLAQLAAAAASEQRELALKQAAASAPAMLKVVETDLAQGIGDPKPEPPPGAGVKQLELLRDQANAARDAAARERNRLAADVEQRADRLRRLPAELAEARGAVTKQRAALRVMAPATDEPQLALQTVAEAELVARRRRVRELQAEQAAWTAKEQLLPKQLELAKLVVERQERLAAAWQALVANARREADARATEDAARLGQGLPIDDHPELLALQRQLEDAIQSKAQVTDAITAADEAARSASAELDELQQRFRDIEAKVKRFGLTDATGLALRREFRRLPPAAHLRRAEREREAAIAEAVYQDFRHEELWNEVGGPSADGIREHIGLIQATLPPPTTPETRRLHQLAADLVKRANRALKELKESYGQLADRLFAAEARERQLANAVRTNRAYVQERILWVRSVAKGRLPDPRSIAEAAAWLMSPQRWASAAREGATAQPGGLVARLLLVLALLVIARGTSNRIVSLAEPLRKQKTDRIGYSFAALAWSIIGSLWLPALVWSLGDWFAGSTTLHGAAVGLGLHRAALFLLPVQLLRRLMSGSGLAVVHLRWPKQGARQARKHLRWFVWPAALMIFIAASVQAVLTTYPTWHESLGRVAFVSGGLLLTAVLAWTLRPSAPLVTGALERHRDGLVFRMRWVLFWCVVALPMVAVVFASLGYYYTALVLEGRIYATIWLLLAALFVYGFLSRWWWVTRRAAAVELAKSRPEPTVEAPQDDAAPTQERLRDDYYFDLPALHSQTQQLFRIGMLVVIAVGLYVTWADTLPALRVLDRFQIYPSLAFLAEAPAPGTPPVDLARGTVPSLPAPGARTMPLAAPALTASAAPVIVTLADVGLAVLLFAMTVFLARHLPKLLEVSLLPRLPIDSGGRYAASALARYTILVVGTVVAFRAVGIGWSQVQWLVAALTFGLAFGLQEIFANFMSGLIILLERPIRMGDIVTVGNVSGYVTRIRMRATTITDWHRKELLVPNKEFITGQLVNWTLTDAVTRIDIKVGIAYGSDTDRAREILLQVAAESRFVLETPKPKALFLGFGESALSFELRVFIATMDHWPRMMTDIHTAIHKRFAEAGIEISFPKRDLHLRSIGPLADILSHEATERSG